MNDFQQFAEGESNEPPRDRYGRYVIPHEPFAGNGLQRVTTFVGMFKDIYRIRMWEQRSVAEGIAASPELQELVQKSPDNRTTESLCELAMRQAGAFDGRDFGTAVHEATERYDTDGSYDATYRTEVEAWQAMLDRYELGIVPEYIEVVLANEPYGVCGTADRIVETKQYGNVVLDIKTGSIDKSSGEIAMQCYLYASATHWWDWRNDRLADVPTINQDIAIIAHLPKGGPCELYFADLRPAREACDHAKWVRDSWRKQRNILRPYDDGPPEVTVPAKPEAKAKPKPKPKAEAKPKATAKKPKPLTVEAAYEIVPMLAEASKRSSEAASLIRSFIDDGAVAELPWSVGTTTEAYRTLLLRTVYELAEHVRENDFAIAIVADVLATAKSVNAEERNPNNETLATLLTLCSTEQLEHISAVARVAELAFDETGEVYVRSYSYGNPERRKYVLEHLAPFLETDKASVAAKWPTDVPPPKRYEEWTEAHMAEIEKQFSMPFWAF